MNEEINKKKISYDIFLVLGVVWTIVGFIIYGNANLWPLGFVFLLVGLIGKYGGRLKVNSKNGDKQKDPIKQ